jgi:hypothetical protein
LIPENDEGSVVDDDLSDALNPDQPVENVAVKPVVGIKEESKTGSGPDFGADGKPIVYKGEELAAKLGPFVDTGDVLTTPYKFCHCITDWEVLYSRYKPDNICK